MKKMNKKGFTIVELVIVIAVIAILAAVMIPTFGGIIKKANQSAAEQEAKAVWKELYGVDLSDGQYDGQTVTIPEGAAYTYEYDEEAKAVKFVFTKNGYTVTCIGNTWSTTPVAAND